jgi:hypothetical protein
MLDGLDVTLAMLQAGFDTPFLHQKTCSLLAQLVERLTVNQNVAGSSPAQGAKIIGTA